jgi:plexin A
MDVREPVVANNSTATTVVFIAPGTYWLSSNIHVLYVGATYTGNSPYRSDVPAVSSRSLARHKMFQIAHMLERRDTRVTTGTRISVDPSSRDRYPIHYVYGFSSEGFSYFLTTQMKESTTNNSSYISKLVRVCQSDLDYNTYTEVPLECAAEDLTQYNLVQAAYVGKPGSSLAAKLNITIQDDVLYAVFAQSESAEGGEMSNRPVARSALCIYSLKSIRKTFMSNIQMCFRGVGNTGLDFISPSVPCVRRVSVFWLPAVYP